MRNKIKYGVLVGFALIGLQCANLFAQNPVFTLYNPTLIGHMVSFGSGSAAVPVGTNCTIAAGSSDYAGSCATTSTTAAITFAIPFNVAPTCLVTDASATSTVSMPVYTLSASAITLSTVINAHNLQWLCVGKQGG